MKKIFVGMVACALIFGGSVFAADNAKPAKKQETKKECKKTDCADKSSCKKTCAAKPGCCK